MGYRISYDQKKKTGGIRHHIQILFAILLLLLSVINGVCSMDRNFTGLWERLLPWTQPQVQAACDELLEHITEGQPIGVCIDAFCEEILNDDKNIS